MREIILHPGLHKTGTTSIQQTLFDPSNNLALAKTGLIYPQSIEDNHSYAFYSAFASRPESLPANARYKDDISAIRADARHSLERLREEVRTTSGLQLVLSGEEVSSLSSGSLSDLKEFLRSLTFETPTIRVTLYVREPVSWATSVIQEKIKGGMTFGEAVGELEIMMPGIYRDRIEKFLHEFGENFVQIHSYEAASAHDFGVVGHFLSSCGVKVPHLLAIRFARANTSLSQFAVDVISELNARAASLGKAMEAWQMAPLLGIRGPRFRLPEQQRRSLLILAQDDVAWLRRLVGIDYGAAPVVDAIVGEEEESIADAEAIRAQLPAAIVEVVDEALRSRRVSSVGK